MGCALSIDRVVEGFREKDWLSCTSALGVSSVITELDVATIKGSDGGGSKEMKFTIRIGKTTWTASEVPVNEPTLKHTRRAYSTSTRRARWIVRASD